MPEKKSVPYLCEYGDHYEFPGGPRHWHSDPNLIETYPKEMKVGSVDFDAHKLTAIPNVWARPLLFFNALVDSRHPAHQNVVQEWRGLLGLICLSETYVSRLLRVKPVDLGQYTDSEDAPPIARAASLFRPGDEWLKFDLIYVGGDLAGATSPWSFVYTIPDLKLSVEFPWKSPEGRLVDPVPKISDPNLLSTLNWWVSKLGEKANSLPLNKEKRQALNEQINAWLKTMGTPKTAELYDFTVRVFDRVALSPVQSTIVAENYFDSDFLVDPEKLRTDCPNKSVLFLWSGKWADGKKLSAAHNSSHYEFPETESGSRVVPNVLDRPFIVPEKYFFTESIVKLRVAASSQTPLDVRCKNGDRYLLPLKPTIFEFFDADFIAQNLRIEESNEGTVVVKLPIPMGNHETWTVERTYPADCQNARFKPQTLLLWPNLKLSNWEHYYLFWRRPDPGADSWTCRPWGRNLPSGVDRPVAVSPTTGSEGRSVDEQSPLAFFRIDDSFEALIFESKDGHLGIILPRVKVVEKHEDHWDVAVDFGTSNTSIAVRRSRSKDEQPSKLDFARRVAALMWDVDGPSISQRQAAQFFVPPFFRTETPYGSLLRKFDSSEPDQSFLYAYGTIPLFPPLYFDEGYKDIEVDLKWQELETELHSARVFLQHILLGIACEARASDVRRISFCWTYPSAFENRRKVFFDTTWQGSVERIAKECGLQIDIGMDSRPVNEAQQLVGTTTALTTAITESVAIAQYFSKFFDATVAASKRAQIFLDIGGGTTDCAVWRKGDIIAQTSVLWAGKVVPECLVAYQETLPRDIVGLAKGRARETEVELAVEIMEKHLSGLDPSKPDPPKPDPSKIGAALNHFLRVNGDLVNLNIKGEARMKPAVRRMLSVLFAHYAAICQYSGLLLRSKVSASFEIDGIDLYFGGNGSRSILWLGGLAKMVPYFAQFLEAEVPPSSIKMHLSKDFKMEVAFGTLYTGRIMGKIPIPTVVAGEDGIVWGDEICDWMFDLEKLREDHKGVLSLSFSTDSELTNLRQYYQRVSDCAQELSLESLAEASAGVFPRSEIVAKIETSLDSYADADVGSVLDPPFIVGTRFLINSLIKMPLKS